ncbi:cell wall-binding repeat-containing protein [Bacillus timonensis]|uniref:cell wall-binding repeat-containing protein n=1 Tax=Bacillus timonensis TaxID=1033734 RepID=UPI0002884BA4|nr:cell wall-binding repeat-containing protein [Bacillus timonensis]
MGKKGVYKSRKLVIVTILVLLLQTLGSSFTVFAASDGQAPIVESIEVSPEEVTVGDTVVVKAEVVDNESGVRSVSVEFDSPSKSRNQTIRLNYNSESELWEGSYTIQDTDEAGAWTFKQLITFDNAGNGELYNAGEIANSSNLNFNVTNPNGDSAAPTIESIEINSNEVQVGAQIVVTAKVADSNSGVKSVSVEYYSPSKSRTQSIRLNYNIGSGLWEGSYLIKDTDEEGLWTFKHVITFDNAGNGELYNAGEITNSSNLDFYLTNPNGDSSAPTIENLVVSPSEVLIGNQVDVKAKVLDNGSGVKSVSVEYNSPTNSRTQTIRLNYNSESGLWEGSYTVQDTDEEGLWTFKHVITFDNAGNGELYNAADLDSTQNLDFRVITTTDEPIGNNVEPLPVTFTKTNEYWTQKDIKQDVFIGPNSVVTINGNVIIDGDVYVYGAIKNYGNLKITGTLHARNVYWGSNQTLYHGTVLMLGGTNMIPSMSLSNQAWEVPLKLYNQDLTVKDGHLKLEGATVPVVDVYVDGNKLALEEKGTFIVDVNDITKPSVKFEMKDVFGYTYTKQIKVNNPDAIFAPYWNDTATLRADEKGLTTIKLAWDKPVTTDGIKQYYIYKNGKLLETVQGTSTSYQVTGLTEKTSYQFSVIAEDNYNQKTEALTLTAETLKTAPGWPEGAFLHVPEYGSDFVILSWNQAITYDGVKQYHIYKNGALVQTVTGTTTNYKVTGLSPTTLYQFSVIAEDKYGDKSSALSVDWETSRVFPHWPENAALVYQTDATSVSLSWDEANTHDGVKYYHIYKEGHQIDKVEGTVKTYEAKGLTPNTVYQFTILAEDKVGQMSEQLSTSVKTAEQRLIRLSGKSRFETAIEISKKGWPQGSKTVVLARSDEFADALAGGPLAYQLDAPILLTRSTRLDSGVVAEMNRLGATKVVILGGKGAISLEVEKELKTYGLRVQRIGGLNRYDTSVKIAEMMVANGANTKEAVIAYGRNFPDALAIAPYAAMNKIPILLSEQKKIPKEVKEYLGNVRKTIVVGGETAIGSSVFNALPSPKRISGKTRYETAVQVVNQLDLRSEKVFVATGAQFADALTGSVLAAKNGGPILLVQRYKVPNEVKELLTEGGINEFYILGGLGAIDDITADSLLYK